MSSMLFNDDPIYTRDMDILFTRATQITAAVRLTIGFPIPSWFCLIVLEWHSASANCYFLSSDGISVNLFPISCPARDNPISSRSLTNSFGLRLFDIPWNVLERLLNVYVIFLPFNPYSLTLYSYNLFT